jgi:transposase
MAQRRTEGWPVSRIADAAGVSRRTVCTWLGRTSLENHSSRARRIASRPSDRLIEDMARLRGLRLTGAMIAHRPRLSRSTVAAWLNRLGPGRLTLVEPKPAIQRYERERAGELIHVDIKKLGRFNEIGPRIPGDAASRQPIRNIGWDFVHVAIDDDSLLACVEVLPDETGLTASGLLKRPIAWRRAPKITIERIMSEKARIRCLQNLRKHPQRAADTASVDAPLHAPHQRPGRELHPDRRA